MERIVFTSLLIVVLTASSTAALAQECPVSQPVKSHQIADLGLALWPLQSDRSEVWRRAGNNAGSRFTELTVSAGQEIEVGDLPAETSIDVGLAIALGDVAGARRDNLEARGNHDLAALDARAFEFVMAVEAAYVAWWAADRERAHLEEFLSEFNEEVQRFDEAASDGLVSKVDLADVRAEEARIRGELVDARLSAQSALEHLHATAGVSCDYRPATDDRNEDPPNAWEQLASETSRFPAVREPLARTSVFETEASLARSSHPWMLGVGASMRIEQFEQFVVGPTIGLTIPLSQPNKADAMISELSMRRASQQANRAETALAEHLRSRARTLQARQKAVSDWRELVVAPLKQRVDLYESAHRAGEVSTFRLMEARQRLHESEHALTLLQVAVATDQMTARSTARLLNLLEEGDTP